MEYTNVIRRKLISLSEYIQELEPFLTYSYEKYLSNYFIKRTGERLIQLIVENMVDINSVIITFKAPGCLNQIFKQELPDGYNNLKIRRGWYIPAGFFIMI